MYTGSFLFPKSSLSAFFLAGNCHSHLKKSLQQIRKTSVSLEWYPIRNFLWFEQKIKINQFFISINCCTKTTIDGPEIDSSSEEDDDDDDNEYYCENKSTKSTKSTKNKQTTNQKNKCYRCGREGHYSPDCFASKHIKGYYLD